MRTVNIDIEDYLTNGQIGHITFFESAGNQISKIFVKFDNTNVDRKRKISSSLAQQYDSLTIERYETEIKINMKSASSPYIMRTQFPLTLTQACTIHKIQGLTTNVSVVGFELNKQKAFNQGQMFTALSRVTSLSGLFLTGHFNKSSIRANEKAEHEYNRLRRNSALQLIQNCEISNNTLKVVLLNVRLLSKHALNIKYDQRQCINDAICQKETQIRINESVQNVISYLPNYEMHFNNSDNHYSSIAYGHQTSVSCSPISDYEGFSIFKVVKKGYTNMTFTVLSLYKRISQPLRSFCDALEYLIRSDAPHIIFGDFNFNYKTERSMLAIFSDYIQVFDKTTHLEGALLNHVRVKKTVLKQFTVKCSVLNIYL